MGWFGGNPNFNESTGKFIAEDSPDWRDPETGAYVNRPGMKYIDTGATKGMLSDKIGGEIGSNIAKDSYTSAFNAGPKLDANVGWANPSPLTGPDGRFIDLPTTQPLGGVDLGQRLPDPFDQPGLQHELGRGSDSLIQNTGGWGKNTEKYGPGVKKPTRNKPWYEGIGVPINKGIGQINNGLIQMTEDNSALDAGYAHMFNPETGQITQHPGGRLGNKKPNVWNVGDEGYQQLMDNYQQNNPNAPSLAINQPAPDFNMSPAVLPTENINPFADIPMWQGFQTQQQPTYTQPTYTQPTSDGTTSGMPNLGYASSQLAGTSPAGLEKQNLDYAMAQLGMMTGSSLGGGITYPGTTYPGTSTPGFDAPYGGATPDGGYNNPFTGTDSAGRTPDDPYYGGDSDFGTYGGEGFGYGTSNAWTNWGREAAGALPGMWGTAGQVFGDAAMGLNPMPGAGNYIPGTDTYIQEYNANYVGPGDVTTDMYGLGVGEQRDMMIEQGRMGAGMFTGQSADPDQQFFESQQDALTWMNNGVPVADPYGQFTAEAVSVANDFTNVEGSSFGSQAEAQAVADHGFGSDEHMAALEADGNQEAIDLLTPPTVPVTTVPEAPDVVGTPSPSVDTISVHPETGLPTQPTPGVDGWTDPASGNTFYNEDHNWNNPSQSPVAPNQTPVQAPAPDTSGSDDSGGWGDSDAASDMDSDSGWSGADSDFGDSSDDSDDSGGGWGDWGGGDNFGFE